MSRAVLIAVLVPEEDLHVLVVPKSACQAQSLVDADDVSQDGLYDAMEDMLTGLAGAYWDRRRAEIPVLCSGELH